MYWNFNINPINTECGDVPCLQWCYYFKEVIVNTNEKCLLSQLALFFKCKKYWKKKTNNVYILFISCSKEGLGMSFLHFLGPEWSRNSQTAKVPTPWAGVVAAKPFAEGNCHCCSFSRWPPFSNMVWAICKADLLLQWVRLGLFEMDLHFWSQSLVISKGHQ